MSIVLNLRNIKCTIFNEFQIKCGSYKFRYQYIDWWSKHKWMIQNYLLKAHLFKDVRSIRDSTLILKTEQSNNKSSLWHTLSLMRSFGNFMSYINCNIQCSREKNLTSQRNKCCFHVYILSWLDKYWHVDIKLIRFR